jgi:hypothetical protein
MEETMSETIPCSERINGELAQRNAQLRQLMDNPEHDDYFDDPALSIDSYKFLRICFSYGGPSDYLEIVYTGRDIFKAEYVFHDWFDGHRVSVQEGTPMYEYAQSVIDYKEEE